MHFYQSKQFPKLFSPISIGSMALSNRIVMAPMNTGLADSDGCFSLPEIEYYRLRAKGGVGLIITGMTRVEGEIENPGGRAVNQAFLPLHASRMALLADAVHTFGSKIALQLSPGLGRQAGAITPGRPPVSASPVPAFANPKVLCRELTIEEIRHIVKSCAAAARLACQAGFDALEIHGHTGYLVDQFLSAKWNKRKDRYGGSVEKRCTLALEILDAVKEATSPGFPVIFRFSVDQKIEGGRNEEEAIKIASLLAVNGYDALHCDAGCYDAMDWVFPTQFHRDGCMIELAQMIKENVNVPVITVGNLGIPALAEDVLLQDKADLVALGRSLIADPAWPQKVLENRLQEIRPCIKCNELCIGGLFSGRPISCTVNPQAGREFFYPQEVRNQSQKKVMVIGAGLAGMEAAKTATMLGYTVRILEKNNEPGGQVLAASAPEFKKDLRRLLDYYKFKLQSLIRIETGVEATLEIINNYNPDHVILAAGALPLLPELDGLQFLPHQTAYQYNLTMDVAKGMDEADKTSLDVVVVGAGMVGCETAVDLAEKGHKVTVVEMKPGVAKDLNFVSRQALLKRLDDGNVTLLTGYEVIRLEKNKVKVRDQVGDDTMLQADQVIFALGSRPDNQMAELLKQASFSFSVIGDCFSPGKIGESIHQGYHAALSL